MFRNDNIPNLFVIGAPKAGTSALVSALDEHPDIFVPGLKEPRYFDAHTYYDLEEDYPINAIDIYLSLYDGDRARNAKYRVDGSVFNMYDINSILRIKDLSADAKFIVVLRDPLSATKSMFSQRMKYFVPQLREVDESFDRCWELSKERQYGRNFPKGCRNRILFRYDLLFSYEKHLPGIISEVGRDNLHIASFAQLKNSPKIFYEGIANFLQVSNRIGLINKPVNLSHQLNPSRVQKFLHGVAFLTEGLRKRIGLTGGNFPKLREKLTHVEPIVPKISMNSDSDIRSYFADTYEYANEIDILL